MRLAELKSIVQNGRFFTVVFIKRTDGAIRTMRARTGVHRHLIGGERPYDPDEKGLLIVYDIERRGYRAIPAENVLGIHANGQVYTANADTVKPATGGAARAGIGMARRPRVGS